MKVSQSIVVALAIGLGLLTPVSEADDQVQQPSVYNQSTDSTKVKGTLLEVLKQSGEYIHFLAAVEATGFTAQLKQEESITLFVPTNEAFEKLMGTDINDMENSTKRIMLTSFMPQHVIPSKVSGSELANSRFFQAMNDQRLHITELDGAIAVDESLVIKTDIRASNGVIHVIDKVLTADSSTTTCIPLGDRQRRFKTFLRLMMSSGRIEGIRGKKSITSFVPTDEAFAKIPEELIETLLKPENKALRNKVISNHYLAVRAYSDMAEKNAIIKSAQGSDIKFTMKDGVMHVNGAKVIEGDIDTRHGVVHLIDRVLFPDDMKLD